jgi:hypothetical protein
MSAAELVRAAQLARLGRLAEPPPETLPAAAPPPPQPLSSTQPQLPPPPSPAQELVEVAAHSGSSNLSAAPTPTATSSLLLEWGSDWARAARRDVQQQSAAGHHSAEAVNPPTALLGAPTLSIAPPPLEAATADGGLGDHDGEGQGSAARASVLVDEPAESSSTSSHQVTIAWGGVGTPLVQELVDDDYIRLGCHRQHRTRVRASPTSSVSASSSCARALSSRVDFTQGGERESAGDAFDARAIFAPPRSSNESPPSRHNGLSLIDSPLMQQD